MTRPTQSIILQQYTLDLLMLPYGSRTVTTRTITSAAAAARNATSISLVRPAGSNDNLTIKAGTSVSFQVTSSSTTRQQVLFVEDVVLTNDTESPNTFKTAPLFDAVGSSSTATVIVNSIPLFGIQSFDLQNQETTVDTTSTQSGSGTESAMIRFNRTIAVNGVELVNDVALETIIKPLAFETSYANREVYAVATYPNGERYEGAAKVMGFNMPGNQNEVSRYNFSLQFQGDSFKRTSLRSPAA